MDWKTVLGTVAPWIATAVGGPLGGLAMEAAANALGLSEKTEGALKAAIAGVSPEHMMALKTADQAFAVKMQELGFSHIGKLEALAVQDRQNAREREIKTGDSYTPRIIACVVIVGFFAILLVMMFKDLPPSSKEAALIMLGALGSAFTGVISYYYGSTAGSAEKSKLLAQSQPQK
jgi:hypothetical protein